MRSDRIRAAAALAVLAGALAAGCSEAFVPVTLVPPDSVLAQARSLTSALIEWTPVQDENVIAYRVERRREFEGPFVTVADNVPQALPGPVFLLDDALEPETFYGYRIRVLDRFGGVSEPSFVRGTRTPPPPGIVVRTVSQLETAASADADGYTVVIRRGADSVVGPVSPSGERRFGPLAPGSYTVELHGLASNCGLQEGSMMRDAPVTDVGLATLTRVSYVVACADPQLGRLTARMNVSGENRDSNGVVLRLEGVHTTAPDITTDSTVLPGPDGGLRTWTGLRPGDFEVTLAGLAAKCSADGLTRAVQVEPLSDDTVTFAVTCPTPQTDTNTVLPGYQLRNAWGAVSGGRIALTITLDMAAFEDPTVNGASPDDVSSLQGSTRYDAGKLRFVSASNAGGSGLQNIVSNGAVGGVVQWGNFSTLPSPQTGLQGVAVLLFDVLGAGDVATRTTVDEALSKSEANLLPHVVVREAIATLGSGGGGGGTNTPPTAEANGPYNGTAGMPVSFSSAGSADAGGSIGSYAWTFGDGATSSTANPQHVYATAGTYVAQLTVTDNGGATASDQANVVVSGSGAGGGSTPFAWAYVWGVRGADSIVTLTVTLDLSTDIPETPGAEELQTYVVDSLKWDPTVLRYFAFNHGPGGAGSVNSTFALPSGQGPGGKLVFSGTLGTSNRIGLITIATVRFKVVGTAGLLTTTTTGLGALTGTSATGGFSYRSRTRVVEATLTVQ